MLPKFLMFAALAIFATLLSCNAEEVLDPAQFVKDSISQLSSVRAECEPIADSLETLIDNEKKDEVRDHLSTCGKTLFEIASKAAQFDLSKIEDVVTKEIIKRLRNIYDGYKIGEDMTEVAAHWKALADVYVEEDIEYFDDNDILYSIKEIEEGSFITRTEDINEMNYYWTKYTEKLYKPTWEHFFAFTDILKKKAKTYSK